MKKYIFLLSVVVMFVSSCQKGTSKLNKKLIYGTWAGIDSYNIDSKGNKESYYGNDGLDTLIFYPDGTLTELYEGTKDFLKYEILDNGTIHTEGKSVSGRMIDCSEEIIELSRNKLVVSDRLVLVVSDSSDFVTFYTVYKKVK